MADPDSRAAGGAAVLAERGIDILGGVLATEAVALDPAFHWVHQRITPWVALKLAVSLDGRLSREPGRPTAVTGPAARAETHRLRAGFDAIMIGRATVEADDPLLTVRGDIRPRVAPIRVVLDSGARTPVDARMVGTADEAPIWIVCAETAPRQRIEALCAAGARVLPVAAAPEGVDIDAALALLRREGVRSVLCEGGGRLAASLLEAGAVGRILLYLSPVFFGSAGPAAFPLTRPVAGWAMRATRTVGPDALVVLDRLDREV